MEKLAFYSVELRLKRQRSLSSCSLFSRFFSTVIAELVQAKRRHRHPERLLARYCLRLEQNWRVLSRDRHTEISTNGDTSERIIVKIIVEGDLLDFFRIQNGAVHPETEQSAATSQGQS